MPSGQIWHAPCKVKVKAGKGVLKIESRIMPEINTLLSWINANFKKDLMMRKIIIISVLVVGLAAGISYISYAHKSNCRLGGYGGGKMESGMMGRRGDGGYPGTSWSGQNDWNSDSQQKFLEDTVDLRKEMNEKQFEFFEAQRKPNTTREQLSALENDMIDIRTKLEDQAEQYNKQ